MKQSIRTEMGLSSFKKSLSSYQEAIDKNIADFSKQLRRATLKTYGQQSLVIVDTFLDILSRGGKRIRGVLAIVGYEMSGGKNKEMILEVSKALEMIHSYFLIMDDIQDRSDTRRGGPAAHRLLESYHISNHLANGPEHFGVAMALNAMGLGNHAAQVIMANLDVSQDFRLKAISILNRSCIVTDHGQVHDIMNEVSSNTTLKDVDNVLEWKTAHYTILNPLHMGMVLAGADCHATDAITEYAIHAGKVFQITDDILGTFGEEHESGKSPQDDIKEGKRTLLTVYALDHISNGNKNFLIQMLGNRQITPEEFLRTKEILIECGALEYARDQAKMHASTALASLNDHMGIWSTEGNKFLRDLVKYLLVRTS